MGLFKNFRESLRKGDEKTKQELGDNAGFVETVIVSGKNVGKAMAEQKDALRRESAAKKRCNFWWQKLQTSNKTKFKFRWM